MATTATTAATSRGKAGAGGRRQATAAALKRDSTAAAAAGTASESSNGVWRRSLQYEIPSLETDKTAAPFKAERGERGRVRRVQSTARIKLPTQLHRGAVGSAPDWAREVEAAAERQRSQSELRQNTSIVERCMDRQRTLNDSNHATTCHHSLRSSAAQAAATGRAHEQAAATTATAAAAAAICSTRIGSLALALISAVWSRCAPAAAVTAALAVAATLAILSSLQQLASGWL